SQGHTHPSGNSIRSMPTLLIADDHPLFRAALKQHAALRATFSALQSLRSPSGEARANNRHPFPARCSKLAMLG
ncbi:MAG: hypothetical protein WKF61_05965, partial [Luteimonas sp.]